MANARRDKPPPPPLPPPAAYTTATSPLSRSLSISTTSHSPPPPPPWEVLDLVSHHLDPKTLATASCVSRTWRAATSSDHLWRPIATARFPSLATALKFVHPSLPYRRLYALATSTRRLKPVPKPSISLDDLVFSIDLRGNHRHHKHRTAGVVDDVAAMDPGGVFRFDVGAVSGVVLLEAAEEVRVMWHVVLRSGPTTAFTLMDGVVKVRPEEAAAGEVRGLFSQELPPPGCCPLRGGTSGLAADLKIEFADCWRGDNNRSKVPTVEKLSFGLLSTVDWRYVSVENGLRYLQHFLLDNRFS
ncbi:unnamed protein product [Linum tenue]|uniref:F-box protein n=1 Tax=Linum tenue TaxID=586396 RepID=A0AAV0GQ63_9ROSI|nr:unnamed protein product [Linum tenue]